MPEQRATQRRLDDDLHHQIITAMTNGKSLAEAIKATGANPPSVYRWLQRGRTGSGNDAERALYIAVIAEELRQPRRRAGPPRGPRRATRLASLEERVAALERQLGCAA